MYLGEKKSISLVLLKIYYSRTHVVYTEKFGCKISARIHDSIL